MAPDTGRRLHSDDVICTVSGAIVALALLFGSAHAQGVDPVSAGQERIVNGTPTHDFPAVGALLKKDNANAPRAICTGTLIGSNKFLTAAHCIADSPLPANYSVFFQTSGFFAVSKIDWMKATYKFPTADIAVLTLEAAVSGVQPFKIDRTGALQIGTGGTIVGFGSAGGATHEYGLKRKGHVVTVQCPIDNPNESFICWNFSNIGPGTPNMSNTCKADSGGPLLVSRSSDGGSEYFVAGVTSGGLRADCLPGDSSFDTSVFFYVDFIDQAMSDALTISHIDPPETFSKNIALSDTLPDYVFMLAVSDKARAFSVAMNGAFNDQHKQDFDLYVTRGQESIVSAPDCARTEIGQFAFCSFDSHVDGNYSVRITRKSGTGAAQVVMSIYR